MERQVFTSGSFPRKFNLLQCILHGKFAKRFSTLMLHKSMLVNSFRTYYRLLIFAIPLMLGSLLMQHTINLECFYPVQQTQTTGAHSVEVLEETSSEDQVHSIAYASQLFDFIYSDSLYVSNYVRIIERPVPTPPPDLA